MIKTSGYRVSPNEIEEVVYQSDLVKEVVALGFPHPVIGQAITLIVVPNGETMTEALLLSFCKKNLPNYMHPSNIIIKETLARNQNGKIDRKQLFSEYSKLPASTTATTPASSRGTTTSSSRR